MPKSRSHARFPGPLRRAALPSKPESRNNRNSRCAKQDLVASFRLAPRGLRCAASKSLIGFEQRMPIIRRGDTGAGCQLAPVRWAQDAGRGHA
jgi:hypothetical protein